MLGSPCSPCCGGCTQQRAFETYQKILTSDVTLQLIGDLDFGETHLTGKDLTVTKGLIQQTQHYFDTLGGFDALSYWKRGDRRGSYTLNRTTFATRTGYTGDQAYEVSFEYSSEILSIVIKFTVVTTREKNISYADDPGLFNPFTPGWPQTGCPVFMEMDVVAYIAEVPFKASELPSASTVGSFTSAPFVRAPSGTIPNAPGAGQAYYYAWRNPYRVQVPPGIIGQAVHDLTTSRSYFFGCYWIIDVDETSQLYKSRAIKRLDTGVPLVSCPAAGIHINRPGILPPYFVSPFLTTVANLGTGSEIIRIETPQATNSYTPLVWKSEPPPSGFVQQHTALPSISIDNDILAIAGATQYPWGVAETATTQPVITVAYRP